MESPCKKAMKLMLQRGTNVCLCINIVPYRPEFSSATMYVCVHGYVHPCIYTNLYMCVHAFVCMHFCGRACVCIEDSK